MEGRPDRGASGRCSHDSVGNGGRDPERPARCDTCQLSPSFRPRRRRHDPGRAHGGDGPFDRGHHHRLCGDHHGCEGHLHHPAHRLSHRPGAERDGHAAGVLLRLRSRPDDHHSGWGSPEYRTPLCEPVLGFTPVEFVDGRLAVFSSLRLHHRLQLRDPLSELSYGRPALHPAGHPARRFPARRRRSPTCAFIVAATNTSFGFTPPTGDLSKISTVTITLTLGSPTASVTANRLHHHPRPAGLVVEFPGRTVVRRRANPGAHREQSRRAWVIDQGQAMLLVVGLIARTRGGAGGHQCPGCGSGTHVGRGCLGCTGQAGSQRRHQRLHQPGRGRRGLHPVLQYRDGQVDLSGDDIPGTGEQPRLRQFHPGGPVVHGRGDDARGRQRDPLLPLRGQLSQHRQPRTGDHLLHRTGGHPEWPPYVIDRRGGADRLWSAVA